MLPNRAKVSRSRDAQTRLCGYNAT